MSDTFDDFVDELQHQIDEEMRAEYGQVAYERWLKPLFVGTLDNPDGYACITGYCGDTVEIFLRFEHKRVKEARFRTDGCAASIVCGSFASELACGKNEEELADINGDTILGILGGLPEDSRHCAFLAAATLQEALRDYRENLGRRRRLGNSGPAHEDHGFIGSVPTPRQRGDDE